MPAAKTELRDECVRMRIEDRLSLRDIQNRTGASKGSLSTWLRHIPLTKEEMASRKVAPPIPKKKNRGEESEIHQIVRDSHLNGVQVAKVSETAVMLRMLARGFNVFGSVFDGEKADWIVETSSGKMVKIQVKTAVNASSGLPIISLSHGINSRLGRRRYLRGDFDFIVGYDLFTDTAYVWSWNELEELKATVSICEEAKERWDKLRV